jgi:hypothetical protein
VGTRTIVATRIDAVAVGGSAPERHRTLSRAEAWFNGPPYAVAGSVFDEDYEKLFARTTGRTPVNQFVPSAASPMLPALDQA